MRYGEILLKTCIILLLLFAACSQQQKSKTEVPEMEKVKHTHYLKNLLSFQYDALEAPDYFNAYDYFFQKSILNRHIVIDTLITSVEQKEGKYYINGIVSDGLKAEVFVRLECSTDDYKAASLFPYSEHPRALITASVSSIESLSHALVLDSEFVNETFIGLHRYLKLSGSCLKLLLIPSDYYYRHIFGER